ncbi:glycosyltransferase [Isoptericola haloaureus]|uniref:Glycosyltransferase n=1 Tax=Isoptericola haloaureus TaxID=1542902 RepID=A0ABU7Z4J8_9MICO
MSAPVRPVRVLVVDHTAQLGGAELALLRLCRELDPAQVSVRCLLLADGPLVAELTRAGVPTRVLPLVPRLSTVSRSRVGALVRATVPSSGAVLRFLVELTGLLRRCRPDVVHSTSLKADLLTLGPALLAGRPLVWHVHDRIAPDYLPAVLVRLVRLAARLPTRLVANSRATAATLPRAAVVVHPGLGADQVRDRPRPVPQGAAVVGILGRISPTKGQLELVRALPEILAHHPHVECRVVGAPLFGQEDHARRVRAEARRLGVADRVRWVGPVADPSAELDRTTVLVHASPVPEPFGQVVVEAMARGVPVVATDAGGVPEIVGRGREGRGVLVRPGDVPALARAVVEVLDDLPRAQERADRAHAEVSGTLTARRTAEQVTAVWREVARSGRRRRPCRRRGPSR